MNEKIEEYKKSIIKQSLIN